MRILVADDDRTSRDVLAALLSKIGHDVIVTSSGTEAWRVVSRPAPPRLLILDRLMPDLDGVELCRRIRDRMETAGSYVILVTVMGKTEDIIGGLDAGANDYIVKPFEPSELRARVDAGIRVLNGQVMPLWRVLGDGHTMGDVYLPVCAHCRRVRVDKGRWCDLETYLVRCGMCLTHGVCDDCFSTFYPDLADED